MNVHDGDAVGVALGPSAYPCFPILPSLSPYHPIPYPTPLPTAVVWIGSLVEILDLVPSVRFTPNPTSFPKQVICVQCAAERQQLTSRSTWRSASGPYPSLCP